MASGCKKQKGHSSTSTHHVGHSGDAATEHIETVPRPEDIGQVSLTFVNIDWKSTRHNSVKSTQRNITQLQAAITSIVTKHQPAIICFCEVGTLDHPLSLFNMDTIIRAIKEAWEIAVCISDGAATERSHGQCSMTTLDC